MKWLKKGLIFYPENRYDWMNTYAQVPTPFLLDIETLRIFYTTRPAPIDDKFISLTSYIDVDPCNPSRILYIHDKTILALGEPGTFDEFGIHPLTAIRVNNSIYFYYQGWTRLHTVPYSTSLGLAISDDNGETFKKYSQGPLFSRSPKQPYLENGFFILREKDLFHMWYANCTEWLKVEQHYEPVYTIVYANSSDGINWNRFSEQCFNTVFPKEANGRPTVIRIGETYHMWFCYRNVLDFRQGGNGSYRIGYASSKDLKTWVRDDSLAGIDCSSSGWDSEMIEYPYVLRTGNKLYLFYNGNQFGKYGFGYAESELTDSE